MAAPFAGSFQHNSQVVRCPDVASAACAAALCMGMLLLPIRLLVTVVICDCSEGSSGRKDGADAEAEDTVSCCGPGWLFVLKGLFKYMHGRQQPLC